jgi:hypothetical protein
MERCLAGCVPDDLRYAGINGKGMTIDRTGPEKTGRSGDIAGGLGYFHLQ